ncbi:MAG: LacI family DNA-binding transcriptional regulator [Anaerolineae bacterium]|nr:LacI family DNA-binding transcriptional regulator [Anaerolineae bacterium]
MAKRPTQSDVAKLAGVSRATVSYVLNDRMDGRIPITEPTRQKVLEAAKTLGYEPNALARNLKSGASYTIGLLMPAVHNPHYWDILEGAEEEITEQGYHLALVTANLNPERERRCLQSLFQQRLDGLILMPTFIDMFPDEMGVLAERTSPAVFITPIEGADWVFPDIRGGAEAMMDHLLGLGHTRIGFINGAARPHLSQTREDVYREKVLAAGFALDESLMRQCSHLMENGYQEARALLSLPHPPTAIWTINDLLAIGALRAIHERGLSVPGDIALAGFDDIAFSRQVYPPLTTVHMPAYEMGKRAAEFLFKRLEDPSLEPMQEIMPMQLMIRQSTAGE